MSVSRRAARGIRVFDRTLRARKLYVDGTHRAAPLATTLARARALMPRLGITRLANLTGLDVIGLPVWTAIRPNGRSLSASQGKGPSDAAAQASALMESIETWHAEHVHLPRRRGSARALHRAGVPIVDPRRLPRERRARVTLDDAFDWVEGWDLLAGAPVWLPLEAVTLDCVFGRRTRPRLAVTSNGLASGNHLLEAIVHGLCEVIERDAEASWRRERGEARVELATVRDPICRALLDRLAAARLHVTAWDMTSDVEAPAYAAAIMEDPNEPAWRALGLYQGFGCHLSPAVALARALTEAVQTRLTYIAGSRDDLLPDDYEQSRDATLLVDIWRDVTAAPAAPVDFAERPDLSAPSFEEDVRTLLGLLSAAGAESAIVVDLTRDALGVPVAKLVVPGRAVDVDWMA